MAREPGRLTANLSLSLSLCSSRTNLSVSSPGLQQNTYCSLSCPLPHICCGSQRSSSPNLPSQTSLPFPRPQLQQPCPDNPKATPVMETDRLTVHLNLIPNSVAEYLPAVVAFSSLTLFPRDHKDLLLQPPFPQLIPLFKPQTPANVLCKHTS